jgi:uncharacterized protein (DUF58 family)
MKLTTIVVSGAFILIVATLLNIDQLYFMAGMLGAIPLVCYGAGRRQNRGLQAERRMPDSTTEGQVVTVTLELENTERLPKPHLLVEDTLPEWLVREGAAGPLPAQVAALGRTTLEYTLRPEKRGRYSVGPVELTATDPLGIFAFKTLVPTQSEIVVYPAVEPLPWFFAPGGSPFGGSPLHTAEMRGEGSEFYGIREYQPGDPLRRVHWRSSARAGKLTVVEYEHDVAVDLTLLLDVAEGTDIGQGKESTLEYGVRIAASVAGMAESFGHGLRLVIPGYSAWREVGLRGTEALHAALDVLARVRADQRETIVDTLRAHAGYFRKDSYLILITPAWSAELVECVAGLTHTGRKVTVVFLDGDSFRGPRALAEETAARYRQLLAAANAAGYVIRQGIPLHEQFGAGGQ